ncbi:winged helix-turn-helix domain-containing protein [Micromonospora sp. BRA006-A]|nr:winged helix-turn-helix domain-containing protein [Micromonospora sp. BRA006-A]
MTTDGTNAANSGTDPSERPFSLVIGVTSSPAERLRLTELLDGVAPSDGRRSGRAARVDHGCAGLGARARTGRRAGCARTRDKPAPDGALVIDAARSTARWGNRETALTRLERDLLTCLTVEPVRVWSYAELHHAVWRDAPTHGRADVQSLVKRLRRKLDELGTGVTIAAVRGVGLRLTDHRHPRVPGD